MRVTPEMIGDTHARIDANAGRRPWVAAMRAYATTRTGAIARAGAVAVALLPAGAADAATLVEKHGDWALYQTDSAGSRLCFITSVAVETKPAGANRDAVHLYVSAWPKEGVKSEVSAKLGYPLKKGSQPTASINGAAFKMFVKDDRAFVSDPTAELKLIEAMKRGSRLMLDAVSERGTTTTDQYSLSGFERALQALAKACP